MKTTDFNKELTSRTIAENLEKQFGGKVNLDKYNREQLEDFRNKLRTRIFQQEGSSKMNDLLTNETYQKDQAMLQLLNTRIKEMLGEDIKKLKDKMVELSEAKKGVRAPKHTAKAKGSKPDFLDLDKDGNKTEPMKKAARDAKFGKTFQEAMKKKCCCATKGEDSCPVHGMKEGFPTVDDAKKAHAEKTGTGKFDKKETGTGTVYTRKAKTFDNGTEDKPKEKKVKESKSCANGHTKMTKGCDECMGMWESTGDYSAKAGHPFKEAKEKTMSRAAKGVMKYGKEGMKALAKAGKEGKSLEPVKAKYNKYDESTKQRISENLDRLLSHYPKEVEHFKQGGELDSDLQDALWDYYFTNGEIRNYDADASEFIADRLAFHLGLDESLKEGKPSAGLSTGDYSAKKARAGKDIGKPGKGFEKIAKTAGKRYGSKAAGERVAGAVLAKLRAKESIENFRHNVRFVNESINFLLQEDEEGKAKAITAAGDIVNDFTSWMQRVGQYQTKTMIELADAIKADFGAAEAEQFKQAVGPSLASTLDVLTQQREAISNAVAVLAGEAAPEAPMGMEPGMHTAAPDEMNPEVGDEFGAADAAAGAGTTGREMRESREQRRVRRLAEQHSILSKLAK